MTSNNDLYEIIEFDKDYHTVTDIKCMKFDSIEEAMKYCQDESWSGYSYSVGNIIKGGDHHE